MKTNLVSALKSPVTGLENVTHIKNIPCARIIEEYRNSYNIDVSRFFIDLDHISIYECTDTKYRFYYPLTLAGDGEFYAELQDRPNYYDPWKWEHETTTEYVQAGDKFLDVGCGQGGFIKRLQKQFNIECVGLELNERAAREARDQKLIVHQQFIEDHAAEFSDHYDIVASYQVLEHISEIDNFLQASIAALKSGGYLIISVPNNDSFLKHSFVVSNMPPHHMGLWREESLKNLTQHYPLKLTKIHLEPIQSQHYSGYLNGQLQRFIPKGNIAYKVAKKLYFPLGKKHLANHANNIIGHTIMAVYTKL